MCISNGNCLRLRFVALINVLLLLFAGAGIGKAEAVQEEGAMTMKLESPAFAPNGEIPTRYTGEGQDLSPPLGFFGVPPAAKSLVLIIDDPDAPDPAAPKMTWVHWVVFNIPAATKGFSEGIIKLPEGSQEGLNDFRRKNYGGPHPPIGRHRYYHKLYALDTTLDLEGTPRKADVEKAMRGHILAEAVLMGTYQLKR